MWGLHFWQMPGRASGLATLGVLWAASWLLLFLPDLLLYWSGYSVEAAVRVKAILFTAVAALLISTAKSRRFRLAAVAFLVVNQIIWTGYAVYFGQPLSPEHLLLVQYEATDTMLGVLDGWHSLLPWALTLLAGAAALFVLQWPEGPLAQWRWRISGLSFVILLIAASCRGWRIRGSMPPSPASTPPRSTVRFRRRSGSSAWASPKSPPAS